MGTGELGAATSRALLCLWCELVLHQRGPTMWSHESRNHQLGAASSSVHAGRPPTGTEDLVV